MPLGHPSPLTRVIRAITRRAWVWHSLLDRLGALTQLFEYRLFSTLRRYSPKPYRAIWSLLTFRDYYFFYIPQPPQIQGIYLYPYLLIPLLRLLKEGYTIASVDTAQGTLCISSGDNLSLLVRVPDSWDLFVLVEVFLDKLYGSSFSGYRILDIGAYIGDTCLFFAAHGAERIIGFEPAPDNYAFAQQNIQNSPYHDRIELLCAAVAATGGEMKFSLTPRGVKNRLISTDGQDFCENQTGCVKVRVWSFTELVEYSGWEIIDLAKLDCEGAEYSILLDTPPEVIQKIRRWVVEYHASPQPLETRLRELGYQVQRLREEAHTGILWAERL